MSTVDFGREVLIRIRRGLEVGPAAAVDRASLWVLWGALQRAWSEPIEPVDSRPRFRVVLRTRLFDGFSGSWEQWTTLRRELPRPSLSGLVRRASAPAQVELATAIDVHDDNVGWAARALLVAAQAQAIEARHLLLSRGALARVRLRLLVDPLAEAPGPIVSQPVVHAGPIAGDTVAARSREITLLVDALERDEHARVSPTSQGIAATLGSGDAKSILEIQRDPGRPLLGPGIAFALWTPLRGGSLDALEAGELEAAPSGRGMALGRWSMAESGLLAHHAFLPLALVERDQVPALMARYIARASTAQAAQG